MSLRRRIQRGALRVASPHEDAFLEILALRQALLGLGLEPYELTPGFFEVDAAESGKSCIPMLVIREDRPDASTFLIDHAHVGHPQKDCERLWREWVMELATNAPGQLERLSDTAYQKSRWATPEGELGLKEFLVKAGYRSST